MTKLTIWKRNYTVFLLWVATAMPAPAQTFTTLVHFDGTNGAYPYSMTPVQGVDGNLYATTTGTIFRMTPSGALTTLYTFTCQNGICPDGYNVYAGVVLATDGNFYGTASTGGDPACFLGCGTVFRITPSGVLTVLHLFNGSDGQWPYSGVIQALDGSLYGTTYRGGAYDGGTVFRIAPGVGFKTLHSFSFWTDGGYLRGGLLQSVNGIFYGTTAAGGNDSCSGGCGTIFKMTPRGKVTTMYTFCTRTDCTDGAAPAASLIQGSDGAFYGTTYGISDGPFYGTTYGYDDNARPTGIAGTAFKITSGGTLTTLHTLDNPVAGLVQATDGNFYGTAFAGGDFACDPYNRGCGTVFEITPGSDLTTLHTFEFTDGEGPLGGLAQATNGNFYGSTTGGGTHNMGTIFSLDVGLGPFVAFVRDSGKVGGAGGILGQGFTGTTNVSLDGTPAKFTVVSDTFIRATVPAGATTGFVTVTIPSGTLTSNKVFRVTPQLLSFDPPSGPVGTQVTITGVSLTQTLEVGFGDRIPAQFTVNSDTQVTATVPTGAKTGRIGIETKGGIAISSGTFTVTP